MIDLGIDLAGYGGEEPARPARPGQPTPTPHPDGGGTYSLADLQAAGFSHDNPHRGLTAFLGPVAGGGGAGGSGGPVGRAWPGGNGSPNVLPGAISASFGGIDPDLAKALGAIPPSQFADEDEHDVAAWGGQPPTSIRRQPPGPVQDWLKMHTDEGEPDA